MTYSTKRPPKHIAEHMRYDPRTGLFWWLRPGLARQTNKPVGTYKPNGYRMIGFEMKIYYAHRLAWFYMTGRWPKHEIDHKNRNPSDNRWSNLRRATRANQLQNTRRRINNTSGYKGVCWAAKEGLWLASITLRGKNKFLGYYKTPQKAHAAYSSMAKRHFGEFARLK